MKNIEKTLFCILICFILFSQTSCTQSPLGDDEISLGKREIRGSVILRDNLNTEGVFVWLEGFNISTWTDENGEFRITLPIPAAQGAPDGVTGVFNLYFYLANYKLKSVSVTTQQGEFVYTEGVIDKNGKIIQPVELRKFLMIKTVMEPAEITSQYAGPIAVNIHLRTLIGDSATVLFPGDTSLGRPYGTILLRKLDSGELFPYRIDQGDQHRLSHIIGHSEQVLSKPISTVEDVLPIGKYEAIPHLLITYEVIPEGLIASMGYDFTKPDSEYLQLPVRREGGKFEVIEEVSEE